MFKKLTVLVAMICIMNAQESRVAAISPVNTTVIDYSNINSFASYLLKYENLAHLTFSAAGNYDTYTFGTNFKFMDGMFIGLYLNKPLTNGYANLVPGAFPGGFLQLNKESELLFGMKIDDMELALGLSQAADASTDDEVTTTNVKTENTISDIGIRAGLTMMNFDAEVRLNFSSAVNDVENKTTPTASSKREWKTSGINFNGRYTHELSNKLKVLAIVNFLTGSGEYSLTDNDNSNDNDKIEGSLSNISLIAAFNYMLDDDNLFVLAVQPFASNSVENVTETVAGANTNTQTITTTTTILPAFYVGVESRISSWLTGRFGVNQIMSKTLTENETKNTNPASDAKTENTVYNNDFSATFGLGMEFGNFDIDMIFNEGILSDGPYIISGVGNSISNRLTVTYSF